MTRNQIRQAISQSLMAGHLNHIAKAGDLSDVAILVENRLADRIPPLKTWQKRANVKLLTKETLTEEIRNEFQRLFDQLKTPPKQRPTEGVAARYDPEVGLT